LDKQEYIDRDRFTQSACWRHRS